MSQRGIDLDNRVLAEVNEQYMTYVSVVVSCFDSSVNIAVMEANKDKFESVSKFILSMVYTLQDNGFSTEYAEELSDRIKMNNNLSFVLSFAQKVIASIDVNDEFKKTFYNNMQSVYYDKVGVVDNVYLERFKLDNSDTVFIDTPFLLPLTVLLLNFDKTELFSTYAKKVVQG